jgi:hypothetical protein
MRLLIALSMFAALTACVPHRQWRTQAAAAVGKGPDAEAEKRFVIPQDLDKNRIYSLAFVEFKNNGDLWDKRQLDAALRAIDDADQRSDHHALVITFLHGWKNNAEPSNNNVFDFRRQLNHIAAKACAGHESRCGVVGIYLAWSGDLVTRDWNTLRNLTYFNRRNTAIDVASGTLGTALFTIMRQVKTGPERSTNHSVVVGHSFGGLVLEYSISKQMKELGDELHQELGKHTTSESYHLKTLDAFADLVVLINQAAPATNAVTLLSDYREDLSRVNLLRPPAKSNCAPDDPSQDCKELTRPLILSVSSETDLATRRVLPVAETIAAPKNRPKTLSPEVNLPPGLQGKDAKKVFTTAATFTPQLHSHQLLKCDNGDCTPCLKEDKYYIPVSITLPGYAPGSTAHQNTPIKYCLVRVKDRNAWNHTPYWIFTIPTEIVPDHSTIFTERFADFLTAFLPPLENFNPAQPALPMQRLHTSQQKPNN